jgi:hypothetical protein
MRVFQNFFAYQSYLIHLGSRLPDHSSFQVWRDALVGDRYCAVHYLEPEINGNVFLTCNTSEAMQRAWAREHGLSKSVHLNDIVLAQIEQHGSEVFYTQDPGHYGPEFLRRLPGCVRQRVCWQSPPANAGDLTAYDLVVNNFPTSLAEYAKQGVRTAYFTPSYDPEMMRYAESNERSIDVVFVGGYSRHHRNRAAVLEAVAGLHGRLHVVFALDRSRLTRLAESPLGWLLPLAHHRRPGAIRAVTANPVFGRDMYALFGQAKIVLNGAVDSAGQDRGNMRCFESMGCGALMLTDLGNYPEGMVDGETMVTYRNSQNAKQMVENFLTNSERRSQIARQGREMLRDQYSKASHWRRFVALIEAL